MEDEEPRACGCHRYYRLCPEADRLRGIMNDAAALLTIAKSEAREAAYQAARADYHAHFST